MLALAHLALPSQGKAAEPVFKTASVEAGIVLITVENFDPKSIVIIKGITGLELARFQTDDKGNFHGRLKPMRSIDVGERLTARQDMSANFARTDAAEDVTGRIFTAPVGLAQGPLETDLATLGLAPAGFMPGTVSLVDLSSNARLIDQSTTFDLATDTLLTTGNYDLLAPGPVLATYQISGEFSALYDGATGDLLTGVQTFDATLQIGQVVPEPSALVLLAIGLLTTATYWGRKRLRASPASVSFAGST